MSDRLTLEQHDIDRGIEPGPAVCSCCQKELPAFALVQDGANWICGNCLVDRDREETAPTLITWDDVRGERNRLLAASDWTQVADVAEEVRARWAPVRTALRDITDTHDDPPAAWETMQGFNTPD